jgi:polar amino acid transport system permease protein
VVPIIQIFMDTWHIFIFAALLTLRLTVTSLIIGSVIGLIIAFFRISSSKWLNRIATVYIGLIRGTPLIVQIAILYFGIASIVTLSQFWAGALALAIHNGAYIAEIFRGSIQSVDKGQMEAARSLGMTYPLAMRRIILPQAFKFSIPPLGNQFIIGLKDSSLVAYVGMADLWGAALSEAASNYRQLETYIVVGFYYLVLVMLFSYLLRKLELRMDIDSKVRKGQTAV